MTCLKLKTFGLDRGLPKLLRNRTNGVKSLYFSTTTG